MWSREKEKIIIVCTQTIKLSLLSCNLFIFMLMINSVIIPEPLRRGWEIGWFILVLYSDVYSEENVINWNYSYSLLT